MARAIAEARRVLAISILVGVPLGCTLAVAFEIFRSMGLAR